MTTDCTFFNPETGEITYTAILSDETFEQHMTAGTHALLDVLGDKESQYVVDAALVDFTPEELAAKRAMPKGWAWKMPERVAVDMRTLDEVKAQAWERVKTARDAAEVADFTYNGNVYQADRERINGAVTMAVLAQLQSQPYSIVWTLSNNTTITLDGPGMMAVGAALGQRTKDVFNTGVSLRAQKDAATTNAAADAVVWTT